MDVRYERMPHVHYEKFGPVWLEQGGPHFPFNEVSSEHTMALLFGLFSGFCLNQRLSCVLHW